VLPPVLVNLAAGVILFMVHVSMFLRRQPAAIGFAIRVHLMIDSLLLPLKMCGLAG
jgi:hypothetical protein